VTRARAALALPLLVLLACRQEPKPETRADVRDQQNDVPVAINGVSPFQYPPELYDQGIEGEVRLRLWVDSVGHVAVDSTRVISSSGTAALDSAAVSGAAQLVYAPAHRDGRPVPAAFYQPVIFRRRLAPGPVQ
jgi:TonB family protein